MGGSCGRVLHAVHGVVQDGNALNAGGFVSQVKRLVASRREYFDSAENKNDAWEAIASLVVRECESPSQPRPFAAAGKCPA